MDPLWGRAYEEACCAIFILGDGGRDRSDGPCPSNLNWGAEWKVGEWWLSFDAGKPIWPAKIFKDLAKDEVGFMVTPIDKLLIIVSLPFVERSNSFPENGWGWTTKLRRTSPRKWYSGGITKRRRIEMLKGRFQKQSSDVIHNRLSVSSYILIWIQRDREAQRRWWRMKTIEHGFPLLVSHSRWTARGWPVDGLVLGFIGDCRLTSTTYVLTVLTMTTGICARRMKQNI